VRLVISGFDVNILKLLMNFRARSVAAIFHFVLNSLPLAGSRIELSIPLMLVGMLRLNTRRFTNSLSSLSLIQP
jgi:hypothetical protein